MKKNLLQFSLLIIFLFIINTRPGHAQTSIIIASAIDSALTPNCPPPHITNLTVYGYTNGYSLSDSLDVYINFGDGNDSTVRVPIANPNFYFLTGITHSYVASGQYSVEYIVTGPDGNADTLINYNQIIVGDTCGNVSGTVYIDANSNCAYDAGDTPIPWMSVQLLVGPNVVEWSYSDSLGNYYFSVPTGFPYTIQIGNFNNNFTTVCPASGSYSIPTAPSAGNDFALSCSPGYDLTGSVTGGGFRPNAQPANIWIHAYNLRCIPVNGQARLVLDPLVTYVSATPAPANISGDTLTWNFSNLSNNIYNNWWNNSGSAFVQVTTSASAVIGDTVCFTLIEESIAGDAVPTNNIQTVCYAVSNSWDPNDKNVVPAGADPGGRIIPSVNIPLNYTVRFQNTGNDTAYNVFIMDTIDANLDLNTFFVVAASHAMDVDIYPGNAVKFSFNNIMLPDSGANQQASNGFVTYKINQKANLPNGTVISNTAAIYFDFNSPIITNTTVNTIDVSLSTNELNSGIPSILFFPNPAQNQLAISNKQFAIESVEIYDVVGKKVQTKQLTTNNYPLTLDISHLTPGMYFVKVKTKEGISAVKFVKE